MMYKGDKYYDRLYNDNVLMTDIETFIENDSTLYERRFKPIINNLKRKLKKGTYEHSKAPKLFLYLVNDAIKRYRKEYGVPNIRVSANDKKILAIKIADIVYDDIMAGNYD